MSKNPYQGDVEKIKGEERVWRRRVGSYKILYEIYSYQKSILVFDIRRRATSTY